MAVFLMVCATALAQRPVTVSWNPNPEPDIAGYRVRYGTTSANYTSMREVTSGTSTVFSGLAATTTYYFAVEAFNQEGVTSDLSREIAFTTSALLAPEIAVKNSAGTSLTSGTAVASLGSATIGTTGSSETFTVTNTGGASLSDIVFSIVGTNAADFVVSTAAVSSLAPGAGTTATVTFTPKAAGTRGAVLRIASNDADENPFEIALTGTGSDLPIETAPEISVQLSDGTALPDGSATVSFGSVVPATTSLVKTFVLRNSGTAALSGIALSVNGIHASDFTLLALSSNTLAAGASLSFSISFKPAATGTRDAWLHIASNDADENPYDIALSGAGTAIPEIAITRADGGNLTDSGASLSLGSVNLGGSGAAQSFTIKNTGTANLSGISVSSTGSHAGDFILTTPTLSTLSPGTSTTFSVVFRPAAAGTRGAVIKVASNDADENPFDITVTGTGVAVPEIVVENSAATSLTDGSATASFGAKALGSGSVTQWFTIRNTGSGTLSGLTLNITGTHAADYVKSSLSSTTLAAGTSQLISVSFAPSSAGLRNALLQITSNDADENPFDITLSGTGVAVPEIAVENAGGTALTSGTSNAIFNPATLQAGPTSLQFTLRNPGTAALTGIVPSITGPHAADFRVTPPSSTTIPPGGSLPLHVTFTPGAADFRNASLSIASNDADENPFLIALIGRGVAVPDIDVTLTEAAFAPSNARTSATSFGRVDLGSASTAFTYTISNRGTAELNGLSVSTAGDYASDFLVTRPSVVALAPGASTTFTVVFQPSFAGSRDAVLRILSNDADENPYEIAITGEGIANPEIDLLAPDNTPLTSGTGSIPFGSTHTGLRGSTRTFTIRNSGTALLSGLAVTGSADFFVSPPSASSLVPGATTTFKVQFRPTRSGLRSANLKIASNDADESRFVIPLAGTGVPNPKIEVRTTGSRPLTDGEAFINFGSGGSKTFTITNRGDARLTGIKLLRNGIHASDFAVSTFKTVSLEPGKSASFKVHFKPRASGNRWAALRIQSNDPRSTVFDIVLTGKAAAVKKSAPLASRPPPLSAADSAPLVVKSTKVIGGAKYRCITIYKNRGPSPDASSVEVSPDLTHWFSGENHTKVIRDDSTVLQVRDLQPMAPGSKRYIRLR